MIENTVVIMGEDGKPIVYSVYQGLNEKTCKLGWFASVNNENQILRLRWYPEEQQARNAMIRWRLNRLLGDDY